MQKDILIQALTKRWGKLIYLPLLVALLTGQAAMYSRSNTLKGVRDVDVEMITSFVQAFVSTTPGNTESKNLGSALQVLKRDGNEDAYMGVAIWINGEQVNSNHSLLQGKSPSDIHSQVSKGDARYSIQQLEVSDPDTKLELAFFRPELDHYMGAWNFPFLSFLQLADPHSHEVTLRKFVEKLWIIWTLTTIAVFLLIYFYRYKRLRDSKELKEKLDELRPLYEDALEKEDVLRCALAEEHDKYDKLKEEYNVSEDLLEGAAQSVTEAGRKAKAASDTAEDLRQQVTILESKQPGQIPRGINELSKKDWGTLLERFFPRFDFRPSSFECFRKHWPHAQYKHSPELIIKYLARLHNDPKIAASKQIRSAGRAQEMRLSDSGKGKFPLRLYYCDYRNKSNTGKPTFVMLSEKQQQQSDYRYLQKHFPK